MLQGRLNNSISSVFTELCIATQGCTGKKGPAMIRVLLAAKELLEAVLGNVEGVVVVDRQLEVPLDHQTYLLFTFRSEHGRVPFCSPAKS